MKRTLLFIGILLSMLTVCAEDNVLQTIELVPVKDTYNIVLTADKVVDVKKSVLAPNKITLDMKGIRASKTLNTVYNNVSNVDTVMVEPNGNGISIFFQAENAAGTSVSFDSITPPPAQNTAKSLKLSSPIESYAPIYREELNQEKTSELFNKIFKKSQDDMLKEETNTSDTLNKIFSYGLVGLLAFAIIRLFRKKEPDLKIGLTQSLNDREIEMYRGMPQPIGTAYKQAEKPFTTVNYGLNAYQKENKNPYENELPIHNPRLQQYRNNSMTIQPVTQPIPQRNNTQVAVQQAVKKHTTPVNTAPVNQTNPNIDNLKFLESMTAIYEKSGRHDLAQGLKASLNKNNLK